MLVIAMQQPELLDNPRKNLQILVVDGDSVTCFLHIRRLKQYTSFPTLHFTKGEEALDYISKNTESDYLILLAIEIDGMNGWEFLEALDLFPLKSLVHVIMVSCSISSCDKVRAMSYHQVLDYFEKPLSDVHVQKVPHLPRLIPYFVSVN